MYKASKSSKKREGRKTSRKSDRKTSRKGSKRSFVRVQVRSRPSKGWDKKKPKLRSERKKLSAKCGSKCFLSPKDLKYPVCSKRGTCRVDCSGLVAAKARSSQNKRWDVYEKADRMLRKNCGIGK